MAQSKGRNGLADSSMMSARQNGPNKVKETKDKLRRVRSGRTGQAGKYKP